MTLLISKYFLNHQGYDILSGTHCITQCTCTCILSYTVNRSTCTTCIYTCIYMYIYYELTGEEVEVKRIDEGRTDES